MVCSRDQRVSRPIEHPKKSGRVTVPNHQGFDLPKPIVRSIIRQADLTNGQFEALLDD